jgi:predicted outer membrane repeat protein
MGTPARLLLIVLALLPLAACGGKSGKDSDPPPPPPPSWVTDPPSTTTTSIAPVDTSTPDHVVGNGTPGSITAAALQSAINLGGKITFDGGGGNVTITLTQQLTIPQQKTVVIDGGGKITLDGNHATRIIWKGWLSNLTVQHLHFVNGDATGYDDSTNHSATSGGAINVDTWDGYLTVIDCTFDSCKAKQAGPDLGGGAIRAPGQRHTRIYDCAFTNCSASNGAAVSSLGSQLTIVNTTFSSNHANGAGGAIYIDGVALNADQRRLTIDGCTIDGNTGQGFGGALFCVTYQDQPSQVVITNTTFSNNVHDSTSAFAVIYLQDADVTITNSTFTGNSSQSGVGVLWMLSNQPSRLCNCTFSGNSATGMTGAIDFAGGYVYASNLTIADNSTTHWPAGIRIADSSQVWMKNCILANNVVTTLTPDENKYNGWNTSAAVSDGGGNLQWPRQRGSTGIDDTVLTATTTFADPQLGVLQDNGGPTWTRMIPDGGAAMDHGTSISAPARDQRGQTRGDGKIDIGAVERQLPPAAPASNG